MGSGIVDFKKVISDLKAAGYDGSLMLEVDAAKGKKPDKLASEGYSKKSQIFLRRHLVQRRRDYKRADYQKQNKR